MTIEVREDYQKIAAERCQQYNNITFLLGDTREMLPLVVDSLEGPTLFWLDSHNDGIDGTAQDCPLLEELDVISRSKFEHIILIDDAHCFRPPVPHDPLIWPERGEIERKVKKRGYSLWESHDILIVGPPSVEEEFSLFSDNNPRGNEASALIDAKTFRKRLHRNLNLSVPKFVCTATAVQANELSKGN